MDGTTITNYAATDCVCERLTYSVWGSVLVRVAENYRRGQLKHAVTEEQAYILVKPENNWDFEQKQEPRRVLKRKST
jgi:hypothetical protein